MTAVGVGRGGTVCDPKRMHHSDGKFAPGLLGVFNVLMHSDVSRGLQAKESLVLSELRPSQFLQGWSYMGPSLYCLPTMEPSMQTRDTLLSHLPSCLLARAVTPALRP